MNQDYTKLLGSILKNMALMDHIRPSEIPNIDLYMDQVTSFMNDHLQGVPDGLRMTRSSQRR